jgi:uroporphyrinogen decarboxylase
MTKRIVRTPDFNQFLKVLRREGKPSYLPFYEHIASPGFIASRTEKPFERMNPHEQEYWDTYVDFWIGMGFDCVPLEIGPNFIVPENKNPDGKVSHGSEASVMIRTMEDFEKFGWPGESDPIHFAFFEMAAKALPEGVKIVGGVSAGPYEWVSTLMGVQGLAFAIYMDPELVQQVFEKIESVHVGALRQLATMDFIGALRQGDDLGFKTSTFLNPDHLRQYVFPIYKKMAQTAHDQGKPFILHSCGNLKEVYEDLIVDCKIDAKHSYEDQIWPVSEFKKTYGKRITPLGGLDVDKICRGTEEEIRAYARQMIELCFYDGYWALGTGNSLTDYMPVQNYIYVLEEALKIAG